MTPILTMGDYAASSEGHEILRNIRVLPGHCSSKAQGSKVMGRPMLHPMLRVERSQYNTLIEELSIHDRARFKNYTRLSPEMFDEVLERLTP